MRRDSAASGFQVASARESFNQDNGNVINMAKKVHVTPMLDELENGPWPSFISGIVRCRLSMVKVYQPAKD